MYSTIKDYFDLRLAEFNASNGSYLIEVSTKLNNPPAGQRQRNYTVTLSGFEEGQLQSEMYNVEGEITLTFNLINKNIDTYETLQQYVYNLARYIRRKHQYSVNNKKWNVREISGSDLDNILNDKLVCKLEFTGDFYETNAVTITAPSTPTLSTPANAGTGTVDQSFNWSSVSGAISYTFEISDPTGILFTQSGLSVSSFTIPADSLLTAGTVYQWRVKAVGEGGSSAWTDYFSFTAQGDSTPDYRTGLVAEWDADTGVTSSSGAISAWVDQVGGYSFTQTTAGAKPALVTSGINSKAYVQFSASQYMDMTNAINLAQFTVMLVYKSDSASHSTIEFILGGQVQGIIGMSPTGVNNTTFGYFINPTFRTKAFDANDINSWHVRSIRNAKLFSNGTEVSYNNTGTATALSVSRVGCRADNTVQTFTGKLARVRIYSGQLSDANREIAETYLNSIYAIY